MVSLALNLRYRLGVLFYMAFLCAWVSPIERFHPAVCVSAAAEAEDGFTVEVSSVQELAGATLDDNSADILLQVEVIRDESTLPAYLGKRVLIYHTHTYEAYEQDPDQRYHEIEKWRTSDSDHNVVAVGKALSVSLTALGIEVVHDTTAFEPPTLDDAYGRSLDMLESRSAAGERYDLYIDLHRDAIASTSTINRTVNISGVETARFMVLVGKGTTGGYEIKPNWEKNLIYAQRISESLNEQCANMARDIKVKTGRFNQHIADCCILIECGMNCNTLEEVLAGIPYLAQAIAESLIEPN